jgi:hypothetical protein
MAAPQAAANPFTALPHALLLNILRRLPADERLLCALVCRAFRAALSDDAAWTHLDLSPAGGVVRHDVTDGLLHAAAAKARGTLQALDVSGCPLVSVPALLAAVAADGAALRTLRFGSDRDAPYLSVENVRVIFHDAPLLRELRADVDCRGHAEALTVLRNVPPLGPLRVHALGVHFHTENESESEEVDEDMTPDDVLELLAAVTAYPPGALSELRLYEAPLDEPELLDAVVECARARALSCVHLSACSLSPASVPVLARLLAPGCVLASLELFSSRQGPLLDEDSALELADALRTNNTLTRLELHSVELWSNPAAASAVIFALTGHSSVRMLSFGLEDAPTDHAAFAGLALGALVAANEPALTTLAAFASDFSDVAMRPLFQALPRNTHLRRLECTHNALSDEFARDVLLPAVRANTSLEVLQVDHGRHLAAAEALVAARSHAARGDA